MLFLLVFLRINKELQPLMDIKFSVFLLACSETVAKKSVATDRVQATRRPRPCDRPNSSMMNTLFCVARPRPLNELCLLNLLPHLVNHVLTAFLTFFSAATRYTLQKKMFHVFSVHRSTLCTS